MSLYLALYPVVDGKDVLLTLVQKYSKYKDQL